MTTAFENRTYNENESDSEILLLERNIHQSEIVGEDRISLEFHGVKEALDELYEEEVNEDLDEQNETFSKISLNSHAVIWRSGPAPITEKIDIISDKIAVLQGPKSSKLSDISSVQQNIAVSEEEENMTASMALISYFAELGIAGQDAVIDLPYLKSLLQSANINSRDDYGQSILHEVAREWTVDLAYFLKVKGCDVNGADKYGRTPLIVAAAANHHEMVKCLVEHGANLKHRTMEGEGQSAIHYAAKYDALDAFKVLVELGADPIERDDRDRTPFFLAAEQGLTSICEYMLEIELPTASYNDVGVGVIDHIITKLPLQLATKALNQFIVVEKSYRRRKSYLSCLTKKRWKILTNATHCHSKHDRPTPLELIVQQNDLDLICHPIILELIELKRDFYGFKFSCINILLCFLFTIIWSIALTLPINMPDDQVDLYVAATVALTAIGQLLAFIFAIKLYFDYHVHSRAVNQEKKDQLKILKNEYKFCHPRWAVEEKVLKKNAEVIDRFSVNYWADGWNVIEALCLVMSAIETVVTILRAVSPKTAHIEPIHNILSAFFVLIVWLRLNRYMRIIGSLGPFIAMLGECVIATARFAFLFFEFFIPFSVAFWVLFGGERKDESGEIIGGEYEAFNDMLYQLYLLTIVGDYEYDDLQNIDKAAAQIIVGSYFILVSVISLNLFIALLSEAVARVNETASATSYLREAELLISIERQFPEIKRKFEIYLNQHYAPKIRSILLHGTPPDQNTQNARGALRYLSKNINDTAKKLHHFVQEQQVIKTNLNKSESVIKNFGQKYNQKRLGEMEHNFESVYKFNLIRINKWYRRTRNRVSKLFIPEENSPL